MKVRHYLSLLNFGIKTILSKKRQPILGTIILTDACNLTCKHCAVNNITRNFLSYNEALEEMRAFYREGIRILFFCGGETFIWKDGEKTIRHLVLEARKIGFFLVNVVTNGTLDLKLPEADVLFLSLDGLEQAHNYIRGETFSQIMENVEQAEGSNICVYTAVNNKNYKDIRNLAELVRDTPNLKSLSFNLHTPYEGTEDLTLSRAQKVEIIGTIKRLIKEAFPVFNLYSALDHYLAGSWDRPCYQCIVSEEGKRYVCGRCVEIPGLCEECGYLFAVEFSLLFRGHLPVIWDMLKTYKRYS